MVTPDLLLEILFGDWVEPAAELGELDEESWVRDEGVFLVEEGLGFVIDSSTDL